MKKFFVFLADFYDYFFPSNLNKPLENNDTLVSSMREYQKKHYKIKNINHKDHKRKPSGCLS